MQEPTPVKLMRLSEVAQLFGVCNRTVSMWHKMGKIPPAIPNLGRLLRWRSVDIYAHITKQQSANSANSAQPEGEQQANA